MGVMATTVNLGSTTASFDEAFILAKTVLLTFEAQDVTFELDGVTVYVNEHVSAVDAFEIFDADRAMQAELIAAHRRTPRA